MHWAQPSATGCKAVMPWASAISGLRKTRVHYGAKSGEFGFGMYATTGASRCPGAISPAFWYDNDDYG